MTEAPTKTHLVVIVGAGFPMDWKPLSALPVRRSRITLIAPPQPPLRNIQFTPKAADTQIICPAGPTPFWRSAPIATIRSTNRGRS